MESSVVSKERKMVQNATSKISFVVHRMLLPLLDMPLRGHIRLDTDDDQPEMDLLEQMRRKHPEAMSDRASFVKYFTDLFDMYERNGYSAVMQEDAPCCTDEGAGSAIIEAEQHCPIMDSEQHCPTMDSEQPCPIVVSTS